VGRTKDIRDQMRAAGLETKDHEIALALLAGLPSEFAMITTVLTAGNEELDLDGMLAKLLSVEEMTKPDEPKAYLSNHGRGGRSGYSKPRWQQGGQGGNQAAAQTEMRECFYCHKKGHVRKDCRKRLRDEAASAGPSTQQANSAVYGRNLALTAREPSEAIRGEWVLDSGATRHITFELEYLVNVREAPKDMFITCANGRKEKVCAIGDAVLSGLQGISSEFDSVTLHDVLYVPGGNVNLLSVLAATCKGLSFQFGRESCVLRWGNKVVGKVNCTNGAYSLRSKAGAAAGRVAKTASGALLANATPQLWH
jgi:hypothetical protein